MSEWRYLDSQGIVQGPFSEETMQTWFKEGYFADSIKVKCQMDVDFIEIGKRRPTFATPKTPQSAPAPVTPTTPSTPTTPITASAPIAATTPISAATPITAITPIQSLAPITVTTPIAVTTPVAATTPIAPATPTSAIIPATTTIPTTATTPATSTTPTTVQTSQEDQTRAQKAGIPVADGKIQIQLQLQARGVIKGAAVRVAKIEPVAEKMTDISGSSSVIVGPAVLAAVNGPASAINHEKVPGVTVGPRDAVMTDAEPIKEPVIEIVDSSAMGPPPTSDALHWLYIDNDGKIQGPFPNEMMMAWYKGHHFEDSIRIQRYNHPEPGAPPDPKNIDPKNFIAIADFKNCEFTAPEEKPKPPKISDWFYLDSKDKARGPYTAAVMLNWVNRGFLQGTVKVRAQEEQSFRPIGERQEPFGFDKDKEEPTWWFIDSAGKERGPFLLSLMTHWYNKGFFPEDTKCRQLGERAHATIKQKRQLFTKIEEPVQYENNPMATNEEVQWFYVDMDNGKEQGPFTDDAMKAWYIAGYIPPTTKVRQKNETHFIAVKDRPYCSFVPPPPPTRPSTNVKPRILNQQQQQQQKPQQPAVPALPAPVPKPKPAVPQQQPPVQNRLAPPSAQHPQPKPRNTSPEPDWFYIGDDGKEIGPHTTNQMREWWNAGYINPNVRVRQADEGVHRFAPIRTRNCCFTRPKYIAPPPNMAQTQEAIARLTSTLDQIDTTAQHVD